MEKNKWMLAKHITQVTQEEKLTSSELSVGESEQSRLIMQIMTYLDREIQKLHPKSLGHLSGNPRPFNDRDESQCH